MLTLQIYSLLSPPLYFSILIFLTFPFSKLPITPRSPMCEPNQQTVTSSVIGKPPLILKVSARSVDVTTVCKFGILETQLF